MENHLPAPTKRAFRWTVAIILVASTAASCGPASRSVEIKATDSGSQVKLRVGDTLALDLGGGSLQPWRRLVYPRSLMSLSEANRDQGQFRFLAVRAGNGVVAASVLAHCGPPAFKEIACAVKPALAGGGSYPGRFMIRVRVSE
jgi:hypothetical protein